MNREIKFRAWEPDSKTMYLQAMVGEPANPSVWTKANWRECTENVVVMQSTGLTDKNGKEIYENDLMKSIGKYGEEIGRVVFNNASYEVYIVSGFGTGSYVPINEMQKVIGNVFETPNLLKDKPNEN